MDQSSPDNGLETEEEDSKVADAGNKVFEGSERRRMESIGEDQDEEAQSYMSERSGYLHIPYQVTISLPVVKFEQFMWNCAKNFYYSGKIITIKGF